MLNVWHINCGVTETGIMPNRDWHNIKRRAVIQNNITMKHDREKTKQALFSDGILTSWHPYAVLAVISALMFGRAAWFEYTYLDDDLLILRGFNAISNFSQIEHAFRSLYIGSYYRPVITLSLIVDAQISGTSPWMYHCSNIIFHIITSCLIFHFIIKLQFSRVIAFVAGILFAVHPIVTQSVAWIPGRNDSLLAIFLLCSTIALIRFSTSNKVLPFISHLLTFFLALLSKESALIFPILGAYYLYVLAGVPIVSKKFSQCVVGWALVLVVWYFMRASASGEFHREYMLGTLVANLRTILELLGKMAVPMRLSPYPSFDSFSLMIGAAVTLAIFIGIVLFRDARSKLNLFALLWMLALILPGLIIHIDDSEHRFAYLESRAYPSLIGLVMFVASVCFQKRSLGSGKWGNALCMLAICLYAIRTFGYSETFRDAVTHWEYAVSMSPRADHAYFNLGLAYLETRHDPAKAIESYKNAVALAPSNSKYRNDLGIAYGKQGMFDQAELEFKNSIAIDSTDPFPYSNIGYARLLKNDLPGAEM
jgi:tetratricopeptide (TPR) repeat protein